MNRCVFDTLKVLSQRQRMKAAGVKGKIDEKDLELVYGFTKQLVKEFGSFIHAVILWGSIMREGKYNDIDLLVLVDDLHQPITDEIVSTYRLAVGKILAEVNAVDKLHITTLGISDYWDAVRNSDPVIITLLRDGTPIVDTGFFKPMKKLLEKGRFKPTKEAVEAHLNRAKLLLRASNTHMLVAVDDLYWAVMDACQSALMSKKLTPGVPSELPEMMKKEFKGKITQSDLRLINDIRLLIKHMSQGKIKSIKGKELDILREKVEKFVLKMEKIIKGSTKSSKKVGRKKIKK